MTAISKIKEFDLLNQLIKFIRQAKSGKHLQQNGKRITKGSIDNYFYLYKALSDFSEIKTTRLRFKSVKRLTKREMKAERKYWKNFYADFTNYLYDDLNCFDNYVSSMGKLLRSFFNYLNNELDLNIGNFHKGFYSPSEEIQIVVLSPERLNFLIEDAAFSEQLPKRLQPIKDMFVLGCTVALRFSDLIALKTENFEYINDRVYLKVRSRKTHTFTGIKLPAYAVDIINKYRKKGRIKLPSVSNFHMNKCIREIMVMAGWTEPFICTRQKRGIPQMIYKDNLKKTHFRFCDMITTHTMRRTAITSLLCVGMSEDLVRKISGHAAGSKEFFRYVNYAQTYVDKEIDLAHSKLREKKLENTMPEIPLRIIESSLSRQGSKLP